MVHSDSFSSNDSVVKIDFLKTTLYINDLINKRPYKRKLLYKTIITNPINNSPIKIFLNDESLCRCHTAFPHYLYSKDPRQEFHQGKCTDLASNFRCRDNNSLSNTSIALLNGSSNWPKLPPRPLRKCTRFPCMFPENLHESGLRMTHTVWLGARYKRCSRPELLPRYIHIR